MNKKFNVIFIMNNGRDFKLITDIFENIHQVKCYILALLDSKPSFISVDDDYIINIKEISHITINEDKETILVPHES